VKWKNIETDFCGGVLIAQFEEIWSWTYGHIFGGMGIVWGMECVNNTFKIYFECGCVSR
jgi:hypothetical protein